MSDLLKAIDAALKPEASMVSTAAPRPLNLSDRIDEVLLGNEEAKRRRERPKGKVTRVVDGDTVEVEGLGRVRLLGIDAPEATSKVEPGGRRATRYMQHLTEGKDVSVEITGDKKDKYGRVLANVYADGGTTSLAAEMLDTSLADAFPGVNVGRTSSRLRDGEAAAAASRGALSGLVKGMIYPVSAFVPSYYKKLDQEILESRSTLSKFFRAKGIADETTNRILAATPDVVGEFVGSIAPGVGAYSGARAAIGVGKAASFASKAARTLGAGAASGTALSTFAYLDDGESRLAHVAYNTAIGGAFETLGLPLLRRAWKQEVAEKAASGILADVSKTLNVDPVVADDAVTAIRAGLAPKDVPTARAIVDTIRTQHPDAIGSTVDTQAKKVLDTWVDQILPDRPPTVEPSLRLINPNYGVSFDILAAEKRIPRHIESSPKDIEKFGRDMSALRQELYEYTSSQGIPVKIDNIRVHSQASYTRFTNYLYGREGSGAPPLRGVPGSAPEASAAFRGDVPTVGSKAKEISTGQEVTLIDPPIQMPVEAPPESQAGIVRPTPGKPDILQRANLPTPKASQLPASVKNASVWVQDGSGKQRQIKLSDISPVLDLSRPGKPILSQFKAHPDGVVRHGFVNLHDGTVEIEPYGDYSGGYFRDRLFFQQDPDSQLINMPRIFVGSDQTTISVAPVERYRKELTFSKHLEAGPKDSIEARQHVPYNETQINAAARYEAGTRGGVQVPRDQRMYLRKDFETGVDSTQKSRFSAGFSPRKAGAPGEVAAEGFKKEEALSRNSALAWYGESRQIGPDALNDPHLVTARNTARVLLKKGMSPETKINVRLTPSSYSHAPEEAANWTLRDLANTEFALTDLSTLQEEAGMRGLSAIPDGRGIILRATDGSYEKRFEQQLEAVEAVGRIPVQSDGVKVEKELERAWGYGFERSFDADVDSGPFRPVEFMASGIEEMVAGVRPLVTVWSKDGNALTQSVDALAKAARVDPSAFNVMEVLATGEQRGRKQYAIYNRSVVQQALGRFAPALEHVGVRVQPDIQQTLQSLAAKPHGLGFLYGGERDPMDALLYTYLRNRGEKELWSKAEVAVDNLGPFRKFTQGVRDEVKQRNLRGKVAQGDAPSPSGIQMPLQSAPEGPAGGTWKDLQDEVSIPKDQYFTPRDSYVPPPMAEPDPAMLSDASSPVSKIWNRFAIPGEMFKRLETNTHVPFFQWYRAIEEGRSLVEANTKEAFGKISKMARPLPKEERKRVQLLLETKHSNTQEYNTLRKGVSPAVREAADQLEGVYFDTLGQMGHSKDDISKMLGNFPQVRKSGGDYKVWVRGRGGLPKPMVDMANDFETGVINLDERDLDFASLARRVVRSSANAKHLRPIWDDVDHALKVFSQARGSNREFTSYFEYFDRYRREALHLPDSLANSINEFVKGSWKQIFKKDLPDDEVIDLVSTITSFNYYANMAFQVGMVGRNYLQTIQTTYPVIGAKHTAEAIRWALKWKKDPKLQEEMLRRGVVARDAYIEPLRDIQRLALESGATDKLGDAPAKVMDFLDKGVSWYQSADNFNKVVAWRAQYTKAKEASDRFLEKKISWPEWIRESGARLRVESFDWDGRIIKDALTVKGNADLTAHLLATDFARASQFVYTRGNAPYVMQSTMGRLLGQYGTWPAHYVEFLLDAGRRGDARERVEFLGRWVAANSAVYYGLGGMFGADMSRWSFFAPTSYAGGPIAQAAQQAAAYYGVQAQSMGGLLDAGSEDPMAKLSASRLTKFATTQILPLPVNAYNNYVKAFDAFAKENYADFTRRTLGLPKAK